MELTREELLKCIPHASKTNIDKFLAPLNKTFSEFEINTRLRVAAFLAQISHESGSLHYVEEIASGEAYEYRKDLGNLEQEALQLAHQSHSTTGMFYKGRGLIQITGFYNYRECGEALSLPLVTQPKLLCDPMNAARSAGWYWNTHNCNSLADIKDINSITKKINGGFNGLKERVTNYEYILTILG